MLPRIPRREAAVTLALSGLLLWAPLPFGSVTPAAELFFRLAAIGLWAWAMALGGAPAARSGGLPAAGLAGLALLGGAQSCAWPAAVTAAVSPAHARLFREAAAQLPAAVPSWIPLTLDADLSRSAALSWLVAAALMGVVLAAARRARQRRWLLAALTAAALAQLVIGLFVLWRSSPAGLALLLRPAGRIRGTFTNPNHLALLFEIVMAPLAAWAWFEIRRPAGAARRGRLRAAVPLALWLLLLAGVVLSGSRAGLAAALAGLGAQLLLLPLAGGRRRAWLPALALLLALAALTGVLATRLEIRRYETASMFEDNLRSRLLVAPAAARLWQSFPVTGTGLGTFEEAFPAVAPRQLTGAVWDRAHNNPLELLVTGGVVGIGLGALVFGALLAPALRLVRRGRRSQDRAAGLAAAGALGAATVHELLDFGLVIPANHLALLVVLGAAVAADSAGRRRRAEAQAGGP